MEKAIRRDLDENRNLLPRGSSKSGPLSYSSISSAPTGREAQRLFSRTLGLRRTSQLVNVSSPFLVRRDTNQKA